MIVCRPGVAVKVSAEGEHVLGFWCKTWGCATCAPRRRKQLIEQARAGCPTTFLTVTINPNQHPDPVLAAQLMTRAWAALLRAIRAKYPRSQVEALWTIEATVIGTPHMHVLLRAPYIPQRWLSETWERLTGSRVVHIKFVDSAGRAASYVAKYIAKKPHQFGTCKRYSATRKYRIGPKWTPPARGGDDGWLIDHYWTAAAWAAWRARDGWRTVEAAPGIYDCFRPPPAQGAR